MMKLHLDWCVGLAKLSALGVLGMGVAALCMPTAATAGRILVSPGESIQAAVDAALPGDKIVVKAGDYTETHGGTTGVLITKDGISLIGKAKAKKGEKVRLLAGPGNLDGILVTPALPGDPDIAGFRIKGFTVEGFPNNGIKTLRVNNFKILKNESVNNLENGIQPMLSANGLVKLNVSYGSDDSALWVEGSENVRVLKNITHSSPTGIEVTVSNDLIIKKNESYNNSIGMGLYHPSSASIPPLAGPMVNWKIQDNWVHDNNRANSAPPGSMAAGIPPGGGILLLGVDQTVIQKNLVENNDFYGVAIVDYCLAQGGTPFNCTDNPPDVEPIPQGNRVLRNTFTNNGTAPDPTHPLASFAADMVYIILPGGPLTGNCFDRNTYDTYGALQGFFPPPCP